MLFTSYTELKNLRAKGIFGRWECKLSGYESIISFHKIGSTYKSSIEFTESNMKTKTEILKKTNNKYSIIDSKANEYYIINNDGNLELWDKVGLLTTAINIIPGTESKPLPMFDAKTLSGKKFFTIKNNYSKSAPETLQGTNNTYWIVYLADLNTTFRVDKKTENILKAKDGRVPNLY
jgi:hypothetical protein